jgi:hypothetical protein
VHPQATDGNGRRDEQQHRPLRGDSEEREVARAECLAAYGLHAHGEAGEHGVPRDVGKADGERPASEGQPAEATEEEHRDHGAEVQQEARQDHREREAQNRPRLSTRLAGRHQRRRRERHAQGYGQSLPHRGGEPPGRLAREHGHGHGRRLVSSHRDVDLRSLVEQWVDDDAGRVPERSRIVPARHRGVSRARRHGCWRNRETALLCSARVRCREAKGVNGLCGARAQVNSKAIYEIVRSSCWGGGDDGALLGLSPLWKLGCLVGGVESRAARGTGKPGDTFL